jgi:hypothetical protein
MSYFDDGSDSKPLSKYMAKHQRRRKMEGKTRLKRRSQQLFCQLKECKLVHLVGKIEGLEKLWVD